jgi:hypothetical protein
MLGTGSGIRTRLNPQVLGIWAHPAALRQDRAIRYNRVVQKLQFMNNNRLKTARNADFVKNMRFLEDL